MHHHRLLLVFGTLLLAAAPSAACRAGLPRPIGDTIVIDEEEEEEEGEGNVRRTEWWERMHRTPPGVSWQSIATANGAALESLAAPMVPHGASTAHAVGSATWSEVGSKNQAGRVHTAAIGPQGTGAQGATLYVGSSLGGAFRGTLGGASWTPLSDSIYGGAYHLAVGPAELAGGPDLLVIEASGKIRVSRDGGALWENPAGLPTFNDIRKILILQNAAHRVVVYGRTGLGTRIYVSDDYGRTFTQTFSSITSWPGSLWAPRKGAAAATTLYLMHAGVLKQSTDAGSTWSDVSTPFAGAQTVMLAGSESSPVTLYAAVQAAGGQWDLYRSTNGGSTFTLRSSALADFWGTSLCASMLNADLVMYGGVECRRSANGGTSFSVVNTWGAYYGDPAHKLHADVQGIECWPDPFFPGTLERWYACTDGGVFESTNGGVNWTNRSQSGLGISQYYSTLSSRTDSTQMHAGAQDQGYQIGAQSPATPGSPSTNLTQIISGDYGHLTSGDGTIQLVYSVYPTFVLVVEGGLSPAAYQLSFPSGASFQFMATVTADPLDGSKFFLLGTGLYRYVRTGTSSWTPSQWTTSNLFPTGGTYLSALAFAPTNPQRAYLANEVGKLFFSTDHGVTWVPSPTLGPGAHYFYGSAIAVNPNNELEAVASGNGYSSPGVYRTTNGGATWNALGTSMPSTLFFDVAYANDGTGDLYAATEAGAYRYVAATNAWQNVSASQAPNTTYWSIEKLHVFDNSATFRFGTYGRGIWDYRVPLAAVAGYGSGAAGCSGAHVLCAQQTPRIGKPMTLECTKAPTSATGLALVTNAQDPLGSDVFGVGLPIYASVAASEIYSLDMPSDALGLGTLTIAIPNSPALVGVAYYAQAIWAWGAACPLPPYGLSASNGLQFTIQN